jgi:hypothetical protein
MITSRVTPAVIKKVAMAPKFTQSKPQRLLAIKAQML